jgi:hypothetical protein
VFRALVGLRFFLFIERPLKNIEHGQVAVAAGCALALNQ